MYKCIRYENLANKFSLKSHCFYPTIMSHDLLVQISMNKSSYCTNNFFFSFLFAAKNFLVAVKAPPPQFCAPMHNHLH